MKARDEVARFIKLQMNFETDAAKNKPHHHYGFQELKELMDFIYGCPPENKEQEIHIKE